MSARALPVGHLRRSRVDGTTVRIGLAVVAGSVALGAAVVVALPHDFGDKAALIGAFLVCGLAAFAPILFLGRGAAREPIVYYPLLAFPHLAGSSLAWLGEPYSLVSLTRADFTKALLLVAAGFSALWLGWFAVRKGRTVTTAMTGWLPSRGLTVGLGLLGASCAAIRVATGSHGYIRDFDTGGALGPWTEWVTAGSTALDIALAFAAFRAFGGRDRADTALLAVLLALEFGLGLLAASKVMWTLPKLVVVVFIYVQFRGRPPTRWIAAFVVVLLLASPVVEQFRALSRQNVMDQSAPALALSSVQATSENLTGSVTTALDTLTARLRQIENVAVVMRDTPSFYAHTHGADIPAAFATAFVPRVVWPDKPVFDAGRRFPQLYWKQTAESRSATGPSHFGDLYRNWGLFGVILGMGLLGAVFAGLGRLLDHGGLSTLLIVAFTVGVLIRVEDSLPEAIVAFARIMPPVLLAALLLPKSRVRGTS